MSEQGWLKREMEIVQCEVATWPSWKRGEGMDDVKRYKLLQDVRYDDGAFVIPAGQVVIREADYDVLRDERDRLRDELDVYRQAIQYVFEAINKFEDIQRKQAAMTPAGGQQGEGK